MVYVPMGQNVGRETTMGKPKIISLFTGAGGLDYGLEAAGFETAVAVEFDGDSAKTLRRNRSWPVLERDIHDIPSQEILDVAGLKEGEADLLAGGPPCQPFSKSGYWAKGDAGRLDDPRASTLEAYLRVLRDTKPRTFLLENVAGLAYQQKDEGLELLRRTIRDINEAVGTSYSFSGALLNAADYGVPQERERFFIIGERDGAEFVFPAPTHEAEGTKGNGQQLSLTEKLEPYRTAWDALGDLEDDDDPSLQMTGKWADLLPSIPEGENYLYHTERGGGLPLFGWRRRYWSFLLKLSKHLPSWTITAQPGSAIGPFHWKSRRLSVRELCRLQTFPDDVQIVGGRSSYQRQLGNAVPSALAEVLGLEVRRMLGHGVSRQAPKLAPPRRTPVPPPERVRKVPEKYLHLEGEHEAHPGTGLGYGALSRAGDQGG
jgi:DNA (cytosine-5)-methyltransferase 1